MENNEMELQLQNMKVGERLNDWTPNVDVVAVPGGWLFITYTSNPYHDGDPALTAVFVPYKWR